MAQDKEGPIFLVTAGESGVVVLRPEALAPGSDSEEEEEARAPSPCCVRFVNDNVLINGRSSLAPRLAARDRAARLKLQFDDSLTRTFEYPSETSLCDDSPPAPAPAPAAAAAAAAAADTDGPLQLSQSTMMAPLAANTHLASASLSRYTPCKTLADSFALGMARPAACPPHAHEPEQSDGHVSSNGDAERAPSPPSDARPCGADDARAWSEARTHTTDLLF